jgi:hyperosmotically inducible periplasmic protein
VKSYKVMITVCGIALAAGTLASCSGTGAKSPDVADNIRRTLDQNGLGAVKVSQDRDKGIVTLTGDLPSDSEKAQAESIAQSIATGEVVADKIAVVPPADSDAKKVNSDLDEGIEKNLDAALVRNRLKKDVSYDVKNGVVTLTGTVNSQARRFEAARLANGVPNVTQVVNDLQVKNQKATSTR